MTPLLPALPAVTHAQDLEKGRKRKLNAHSKLEGVSASAEKPQMDLSFLMAPLCGVPKGLIFLPLPPDAYVESWASKFSVSR